MLLSSFSILNLDSSCPPLNIPVEGKSLMPFCHFELEHNDYLNEREENENLTANITELTNSRVVEFSPCGMGLVATRSA